MNTPNEVFAIPVRDGDKCTTFYTELLPFVPGRGVEVLGAPVRMVKTPEVTPSPMLTVILEAMQSQAEASGPDMAQRIYRAIQEHLPIYEDVYDQCCELIEPYVARPGRPGPLPGSVVESLQMLIKTLKPRDKSTAPTRARARVKIITEALQRASVCTHYSQDSLMACGIFSGTPANAIACELAEQILELREELAVLKGWKGEIDA